MRTTRLAQRRRFRPADKALVLSRRLLPVLSLAAIAVVGCTVPPPVAGVPGAPTSTTTTSPAPVSAPAPAPAPPKPVGLSGTWNLKFADEFNGTALDKTKWQPGWYGSTIKPPVNAWERQCYDFLPTNASGGSLHLSLVARDQTCSGGVGAPASRG